MVTTLHRYRLKSTSNLRFSFEFQMANSYTHWKDYVQHIGLNVEYIKKNISTKPEAYHRIYRLKLK